MKLARAPKGEVLVERGNTALFRGRREDCLATWWIQATPGTTYWRCLLPARHLPGQALPFGLESIYEKKGKPVLNGQRGQAAIWQFLGDEIRSRVALGFMQQDGVRTLMELDDNYLRMPPVNVGRRGTAWTKTRAEAMASKTTGYSHEMHRLVVPHMDGLIVSTDFLANVYEDWNDEIYVCPNSVDPDDWRYEREEHDAFRIVYYGSPTHTVDAPLVTDALKWASKQPGVEVWTVGFKNPSWSFPHQVLPWAVDLAEARKNLFKFDLGIAPLKENEWANGKSDVKALEYAMAGVMPVLQDSEPYAPWRGIVPMAKTKHEWNEVIRYFVENREDAEDFAQQAKDYVLAERTIQSSIHLWKDAIHG